MSFASNRSPIRVSGVSRGRIVVGGGIKKGGFSMYGGSSKRRSKPRASKKWYADIQRSMLAEEKRKQREENKLVKMQADLDLRRSVRRKIGKFEDTESMLFTQAKIDRHKREADEKLLEQEAQLFAMLKGLKWLFIFMGVFLLATSLWWVYMLYVAILFMRRKQRNSHMSYDHFASDTK